MEEKRVKHEHEDEIDLYEIILILKKRLKYVIGVFLLGTLTASIISLYMPNIYQARATLYVESIHTLLFLEKLNLMQSIYSDKIPLMAGLPKPEVANNIALSILNSFEFKKKVLEKIRKTYKGNEKDLESIIKSMKEGKGDKLFVSYIDRTTQSIIITSEQKDRKLAEDILKVAIEEFNNELHRLSKDYYASLNINKNFGNVFILSVIENPVSFERPVKPKRGLIITVAGVSSLFLGIFVALVVEWWSNVRKSRSD